MRTVNYEYEAREIITLTWVFRASNDVRSKVDNFIAIFFLKHMCLFYFYSLIFTRDFFYNFREFQNRQHF